MAFNIEKETSTVKFMLEKHSIPAITAEVIAVLDVSGSTQRLYNQGTIQKALQYVVPIALNFDDNGDIPVYVFDDQNDQTEEHLTADNYANFVTEEIIEKGFATWGGTTLEPVLEQTVVDLGFYTVQPDPTKPAEKKRFFKSFFTGGGNPAPVQTYDPQQHSTSRLPAIVYVITDGENDDHEETSQLLASLQKAKSEVYFNFIGVGSATFRYLQQIADKYDNVGFCQIKDLEAVAASGDDKIYDYLLPEELTVWLKSFVTK